MTQYFGSCLDSYTSIDIIDCLDMALLNINAKCFLIQYMCIFLFIEFIDFFPFFPNSLFGDTSSDDLLLTLTNALFGFFW